MGATADVAKVFQIPGKYCTAEGTKLKPKPIDSDNAIIIIFLRDIFTSLNTLRPAELNYPNGFPDAIKRAQKKR